MRFTRVPFGRFTSAVSLVSLSLLLACGGPTEPPGPTLSRIEIGSGGILFTGIGGSRQLSATAYSSTGAEMPDVEVSWHSTNPSAVVVTSSGVVSASADVGSAQIIARSGSVSSAPILVMVAELVEGAVTVSDSQVVVPFEEVDAQAAFGPGFQYTVGLNGASSLAIGQIVVGDGSAPIVGRVMGIAGDIVTLEVVPIDEVFASLDLDQSIDLANAPLEVLEGVEEFFDVSTAAGGGLVFELKNELIGSAGLRPAQAGGLYQVGPFTCVSTSPTLLAELSLLSASITVSNDVEVDAAWNLQTKQIVVESKPRVSLAMSIRLTGPTDEFRRITCNAMLFEPVMEIPGAYTVYLTASLPTGVGFEIAGSALPSGSGIDVAGNIHADLTSGFICQGLSCQCPQVPAVATVTPRIAHVAPSLPDGIVATIDAQVFAYTSTRLGIVARAASMAGAGHQSSRRFTEELMSMRAGTMTSASLANERTQAQALSFEPSYEAVRVVRLEEGSISAEAASLMQLPFAVDLDCGTLVDLAGGPASATSIVMDKDGGFAQGEQVTVEVSLDPSRRDYLGGNNVTKVELYEVGEAGLVPVAESPVSPGQTAVTLEWVAPSDSTEGTDYLVFVETPAVKDLRLKLGLVTIGPVLDGVILIHRTILRTGNFATLPYTSTVGSAGTLNAGAGTYVYEAENHLLATLVVRVKRSDGLPSFRVLDFESSAEVDGDYYVTYPVEYPDIECTGVRERAGTRRDVQTGDVPILPLAPEIAVTETGVEFTVQTTATLRGIVHVNTDTCISLAPIATVDTPQVITDNFAPPIRIDFDDESTFVGEINVERPMPGGTPIDFFLTVTRGAGTFTTDLILSLSWDFGSQ